jgi:hypothetical protein
MENIMTQAERVLNYVRKNSTKTTPVTIAKIAKGTRVPVGNVRARLSDLRETVKGLKRIEKSVAGKRKAYYYI